MDPELEAALERLFNDARISAGNHIGFSGRYKDDIEDDIDFARNELNIEI